MTQKRLILNKKIQFHFLPCSELLQNGARRAPHLRPAPRARVPRATHGLQRHRATHETPATGREGEAPVAIKCEYKSPF